MELTLVPAYGRDYKSAQAVREDWMANKDFIIKTFLCPYDGRAINRSQYLTDCMTKYGRRVKFRYVKTTKLTFMDAETGK